MPGDERREKRPGCGGMGLWRTDIHDTEEHDKEENKQ